jgi:hypothetical protein
LSLDAREFNAGFTWRISILSSRARTAQGSNAKGEKIEPGKYKVSRTSQLPPGEYAVVLRPNSKAKSFSGGTLRGHKATD